MTFRLQNTGFQIIKLGFYLFNKLFHVQFQQILGAKVKKFDKKKISLTKSLTKSGLVDRRTGGQADLLDRRTGGQADWWTSGLVDWWTSGLVKEGELYCFRGIGSFFMVIFAAWSR